jgi:2-methylcitrate dehydratase PrpD
MGKVDSETSADFRTKCPETITAFVDIKDKSDVVYLMQIYPKDDPRNSISTDEIKGEFRSLALNTLDSGQVEKIIACVLDLENIDNISIITSLLTKVYPHGRAPY